MDGFRGTEELVGYVLVLPEDSFSQDIFRKKTVSQVKHMGVAGELIASKRLKHPTPRADALRAHFRLQGN